MNEKVVGYIRVSTNKEEQLISLKEQKENLKKYIENRGDILLKIYSDATVIIGLKQNPTHGRRFSPIFFA